MTILVLSLCLFLLSLCLVFYRSKEGFSWSCTWIPNKAYYMEDWLLGPEMGDRFSGYLR